MKIFLDMVGCRLNQAEIENMARQFRASGHEIVEAASLADLVVINTCTVTAQAAADSRQKARQSARGGAEIVLTGCWSSLEPGQASALPGVRWLIPNSQKENLVQEVLGIGLADQEPIARQAVPGARAKTRAFIKVQDGCDNHCTYCITRIARGKGQSRQISQVLTDIQSAVLGGVKEAVLTGVHLGSWGQDLVGSRTRLVDLVRAILQNTDVPRIRLSSLEPWDLDASFFDLWQNERMCRHLHLPLQSGSETVLRRMARKTTPQAYADLVSQARQRIPQVAITTDLICGFPGETDEEFNQTLAFMDGLNFAGGHVFTYSERPGTPAASLEGQVPFEVRKSRNARLRSLLERCGDLFARSFIGQKMHVLWESSEQKDKETWHLRGLTDNYLHVEAVAQAERWNQIDQVELTGLKSGILQGELGGNQE